MNNCSTFEQPRLFSSAFCKPKTTSSSDNLIAFLAAVQQLRIPFLGISWEKGRQLLGRGGTSQVHQALMNRQTSFAFKRVAAQDKASKRDDEIYTCLINEITVLRRRDIQNCPGILELQGIGWEVTPRQDPYSAEVWPVLIFERSQFGDLFQFASSPIGKELSFSQRLKICLDVGSAIAHMQASGIVHGDIKPQNVLVFRGSIDDPFTAKVADFGFSVPCADAGSNLELPRSWPWYAPECDEYPDFTPAQALRTDVFSFAMLCYWLIFEKYLAVIPSSETYSSKFPPRLEAGAYPPSLQVLADAKAQGSLMELLSELLSAEESLDTERKKMLQGFFKRCLAWDPQQREQDVEHSLRCIDPQRRSPFALNSVTEIFTAKDDEFSLYHSLQAFYALDYHVRMRIFQLLKAKVEIQPSRSLSLQLELCYGIGFGQTPHELGEGSVRLTLRSGDLPNQAQLGNTFESLQELGHIETVLLVDDYRNHDVLETAEIMTRQDIRNVTIVLQSTHWIVLRLKYGLACILEAMGRMGDAEKVLLSNLGVCTEVLGPTDSITLVCMELLASTYLGQGRLQEAERLITDILDISKKSRGERHNWTLTSMNNLAQIYGKRGRWSESEKLQAEVVRINKDMLGIDHPETWINITNLSSAYWHQGRWQEAEELLLQALDWRKRLLGQEDPVTVTTMAKLATVYHSQGRWQESEELQAQALKTMKTMLGPEHPETLDSMGNLASVHTDRGRWEEAEKLQREALDARRRTVGLEHPATLVHMGNLGLTLFNLGRLQEAASIQLEAMGSSLRALGQEHETTLALMGNLAMTYDGLRRWEEAERLQAEALPAMNRLLGEGHPLTITLLGNMASTYRSLGKLQEAEMIQREALEIGRKVFGREHPTTLVIAANLAATCREQKRYQEAEAAHMDVLRISTKVLGHEHPMRVRFLKGLEVILRAQNRHEEAEKIKQEAEDMKKMACKE